MSNVKSVVIEGELNLMAVMEMGADVESGSDEMAVKAHNIEPGKVGEARAAAKTLVRFLAQTVVPYFGLKIRFTGNESHAENGFGGLSVCYQYVISGREAVSYGYVDYLVAALGCLGRVHQKKVVDVEAGD